MGKFVIEKGRDGHYHFCLISSCGENIFTSEKYFFKSACKNAINAMRTCATNYLKYDLITSNDGKYYFRLNINKNHRLGNSSVYDTAEKRNYYVEKVKSASPYARIVDLTLSHELAQA